MDFRDRGVQTQLKNIEATTGHTLDQLKVELDSMGDLKHGQKRTKLQERYGLSFVHAETLLLWHEAQSMPPSQSDPLDSIYAGGKAHLRAVYEALVVRIAALGPYEAVPKKGYVSLRLEKQFCMIGPTTKTRVDVGINAKTLEPNDRLRALPSGKLCQFEVSINELGQVDDQLLSWIEVARSEAQAKGGR